MFVSLGVRFLANIEALNMVESVGNLTKHRRAPIVIRKDDEYKIVYVPAISGESFAHAYQVALVEVAKLIYGEKLPVDEWSLRGEFFKFGDKQHMPDELKALFGKVARKKVQEILSVKHEIEKKAIKLSLVADIGGFMVAEDLPIKRTSVFQVGYIIPTYDTIEATAIESQFHVRHVASETIGRTRGEGEEAGEAEQREARQAQMIYYIETASAVYGLTFNIDLEGIGRTSMIKVEDAVDEEERKRRIKVALGALAQTIAGISFGAKRSRFQPISDILSIVATVSDPKPFVVSPPQLPSFIEDTKQRADSYVKMLEKIGVKPNIKIIAYSKEFEIPAGIVIAKTPEELFTKIFETVGI
ncbi:MAG: type I-A CRISPR-associated protein Cas7/Csa2 [Thermoprotei archaeon]|nr:MAG: type I-A CRISPR-associated protein Cas7/Csa2 [Thermoprotei archaeon]